MVLLAVWWFSFTGLKRERLIVALTMSLLLWGTFSTSGHGQEPSPQKSFLGPKSPWVLEDAFIRELRSQINGITYRLYLRLPEGYGEGNARYPVVYLLDADYSFLLARGISEHLSTRNHLKPLILVGIAYGGPPDYRKNRTRDYTPVFVPSGGYGPEYQKVSGGGDLFLDFIQKELIPSIDREYRTRELDRTLVGHSFGGLIASYALLERPRLFQKYIIVSPSLWYDRGLIFRLERQRHEYRHPSPTRLYLTVGSREGSRGRRMVADLEQFVSRLQARSDPNLVVRGEVLMNETHSSVFPAALSNGLRYVFQGR